MKIAIIGYARQGQSTYNYYKDKDADITVCDQKEIDNLPSGVRGRFGENYLANLDGFDLIYRSPSVHPRDIVKSNSPSILDKVTSNTNEFFKVCPTKNIIGVTGTKGKGTTCSLITKMLKASGFKVHLGGNIGIPPLDMLKDISSEDYVVLELANYQLIDIKYSTPIAVCLMVVPEHLNWHGNVEEYIESKKQLFVYQNKEDKAIYFNDSDYSKEIVGVSHGIKIPYYTPPGAHVEDEYIVIDDKKIIDTKEIKLLGKHNWQNICAAITAYWQIDQNISAVKHVLTTFTGLEHRLELVRKLDGVSYYDDSFGTTPETAIVAIEALSQPKVVILGGSDKGADYTKLAKLIASSDIRSVVLIGQQASRIKQALKDFRFDKCIDGGNSMTEIVNTARSVAKSGDAVLLSTACASFDMFKNYEDRGRQFNQAVKALV